MFDSHKLNEHGFNQMHCYKKLMADTVRQVSDLMPEGREKSIFLTKLEEAVFFGAKAIASVPENHTEVTGY
jgi:hypothetical protein